VRTWQALRVSYRSTSKTKPHLAAHHTHTQAYFHHAATTIQRHWRGYFSRKHVHNFAARKAYLRAVAARNAEVRAEMAAAEQQALAARRGGRAATAREQFEQQVGQLHHLVSTRAVPGIFSPPFEVAAGLVPVIEGLTIEEHLQRACKAQVGYVSLAAVVDVCCLRGHGATLLLPQ